jgi:hypothetical protein
MTYILKPFKNKYWRYDMFDKVAYNKKWKKNNPDKVREQNQRWKIKYPDKVKQSRLKWKKNNPDKAKKSTKEWLNKNPWRKTYDNIIQRIRRETAYKNIKCLITPEELKTLWLRDKAYKMNKPSIDRINTYGNYVFENCRYIEWEENVRRPKRRRTNGHII